MAGSIVPASLTFTVGGGPAGLEAARVAAERGHRVRLVERAGELGGQFKLAAGQPERGEIGGLLTWYQRQLEKLQVSVELRREMTAEEVLQSGADAVVLGTGSKPSRQGFQRVYLHRPALPGVDQEYGGIIRHGAKLLYSYCEATVPRIQVITRKAYGGAYVVMDSKGIGSDLSFAWPSAELAVMGPEGATDIVYRREIQTAADPEARRAELIEEYKERFANPWIAAERGYVDDVIDPAETRSKIIAGLDMLRSKREELPRRKHGNVPL